MKKDNPSETACSQLITVFLMTEKGYDFLRKTADKYRSLFKLIVIGKDKTLLKDYEEEIIKFCVENHLPYIKKADFDKVDSEYVMAISWRWLIKHPCEKLIVFHDSLLPKYRGFIPLMNSLINGESEIGVSAIFGATDFDTGDIIIQKKSKITYPIKIAEAIKINNNNYIACAEFILDKLLNGIQLTATKQNESAATYSVWRDEYDYKIDWSQSASDLRRLIDAVGFPYKGAKTLLDGKTIRIISVEEVPDVKIENRHPGKLLFINEGNPVIICGQGMLKITHAHIEDEEGKLIPFLPLSKFRIRFT